MTRRQENRILKALDGIYVEVHENNLMLKQIIKVINTHLARHHQENEDDFNRNILANMISSGIGIDKLIGGR